MDESLSGLGALTETQSYDLLRSATVGRIVYTDAALPAITPVNFTLDGQSIVFRTALRSRLARAVDGAVVAFQVDNVQHDQPAPGRWWSVVVLGVARTDHDDAIADPSAELTGCDAARTVSIRLVPSQVTGWRTPVPPNAAVSSESGTARPDTHRRVLSSSARP